MQALGGRQESPSVEDADTSAAPETEFLAAEVDERRQTSADRGTASTWLDSPAPVALVSTGSTRDPGAVEQRYEGPQGLAAPRSPGKGARVKLQQSGVELQAVETPAAGSSTFSAKFQDTNRSFSSSFGSGRITLDPVQSSEEVRTGRQFQLFRQDLLAHHARVEKLLAAQAGSTAEAALRALRQEMPPLLEQHFDQMHRQMSPAIPGMMQSAIPWAPPGAPEITAGLGSEAGEAAVQMRLGGDCASLTIPPPEAKHAFHKVDDAEELAKRNVPEHLERKLTGKLDKQKKKEAKIQSVNENESCIQRWARIMVQHSSFELLVSTLLIFSSATIALETQVNISDLKDIAKTEEIFRIMDIIWSVCFCSELGIRLVAERSFFLSTVSPDLSWNIFDSCLVGISVTDVVISLSGMGATMDLSKIRVIRMIRLVRILRLVRVVRFFSEFRNMVNGIAGSVKVLVWAMLLLLMIMFICGIMIMQIATGALKQLEEPNSSPLMRLYGSIPMTILTLFKAISGGMDWTDCIEAFGDEYWYVSWIFAAYVFFTVFCCLNIVLGIFVDRAKAIREADAEMRHMLALEVSEKWIEDVIELFNKADTDGSSGISLDEFETCMQNKRVQTNFANLGISLEHYSVEELFDLFDADSSGCITYVQFADAIKQFHGSARSIDVYKLRRDTRKILTLIGERLPELHPVGRK